MQDTPKGLRKHIAIFGRRNAGKSTLLNALAGQEVSIVSSEPGTTTDPVEKTMEMDGLGPIVLVDTAGIDDLGDLGQKRVKRSLGLMPRMDVAVIVTDKERWGQYEENLSSRLTNLKIPYIVARNKMDMLPEEARRATQLWRENARLPTRVELVDISAKYGQGIQEIIFLLRKAGEAQDNDTLPILSDLIGENGVAVFVVPLDSGAPKGRLILPQVLALRDCLDSQKICLVQTEVQYEEGLKKLAVKPDLVICDSQVVRDVATKTPEDIPLTTFSILMARFKGNLNSLASGAAALKRLKNGDTVLIQEACSHHPQVDDIGRVKIPAMLRTMAGENLNIRFAQGKELSEYDPDVKAVVHCGGCVITRRQMLERQNMAAESSCAMTNYGMAISLAQGVLPRTLAPFPTALAAFNNRLDN